MSKGWIKLYRKIQDSRVFAKPEILKLWILCLVRANHETNWVSIDRLTDPVKVEPGQFITGRYSLHKDFYPTRKKTNKSPLTVWRWLEKLEAWGKLNIETNNVYSLITVVNWDKYQVNENYEQQNEQRMNSERTTNEQRVNTEKNDKNVKNDKKSIHTPPDFEEVKAYFKEKGYDNGLAKKFYSYYQEPMEDRGGRVWKDQNGNTVKSWKQKAIAVWMKDGDKSNPEPKGFEILRKYGSG